MKIAPRKFQAQAWPFLSLLMGALGAIFTALPVHADVVLTSQVNTGTVIYNGTGWTQTLGTGLQGEDIKVAMDVLSNSGTVSTSVRIECFTESTYTTNCAGSWPLNPDAAVDVSARAVYTWEWAALTLNPAYYYRLKVDTAYNVKWYGTPLATLYYVVSAVTAIDWSAIYTPFVYSTTSAAIATSSGLWNSVNVASSTPQCNTGNFFSDGICGAFSFLFTPNPEIMQSFAGLPGLMETKFPFSWVVGVQNTFAGLTASSTSNMIALTLPLHTLGVGSTTPLGLANIVAADVTAFSSSTIETYIPAGTWALFQTLIGMAIWLAFAGDVFFTVRNQMHRV